MSHRLILWSLPLVVSACGGNVTIDSTSNGASGSSAIGSGGSTGTWGAAGGTVATGGSSGAAGSGGLTSADWTACGPSDTCLLEPVFPCPICEPVPIDKFTAINSAYAKEYVDNLPKLTCVSAACPLLTPDQLNVPNYYATCEQGHCQVVDLRTSPLSACATSSDCYVRSGTSCCGCGSGNWIAASYKANLESVFCAPGTACAADCVPSAAPCLTAYCLTGQCTLSYFCPD